MPFDVSTEEGYCAAKAELDRRFKHMINKMVDRNGRAVNTGIFSQHRRHYLESKGWHLVRRSPGKTKVTLYWVHDKDPKREVVSQSDALKAQLWIDMVSDGTIVRVGALENVAKRVSLRAPGVVASARS